MVRTFDAGADDYVAKPFQVAELRARIDSRLRAHRAERALQHATQQASDLAEQNYRLYEQARRDSEDRAALLRELDHRVRNNLSIIMGLVTLERTRDSGRSASEAILSLENRLRSFLMAYEGFRRTNYRGVEMRDITDRILQRLKNTLRPEADITISVSGEDATIPERFGFALALAVNEVGSIAFRHAFPNGRAGQIAASFVAEPERIEIVVADDGVPYTSSDEKARETLEMEQSVLRALVETELGGRVTFEPADRGSRVRISVPRRLEKGAGIEEAAAGP